MTFKDLLQQISEVQQWLKTDIGVKDFSETRIPKIIECLEYLDKEQDKFVNGEVSNMAGIGNDSDAAVIETIALNTIKQGLFKYNKSQLPITALKICLKGSFSSLDEDKKENDNQSRNSLYELELGAYLLLNKIPVNHFDDINFNYDKYKVAIQCKRPLYLRNLRKNLEKAVQQLKEKNDIDKDVNSLGLVAISLEKMYELDKLTNYESKDEMKGVISAIYHQAEKEIMPIWNEKKTTKFIGIILTLKTTGAFRDSKQIQTVNTSVIRCRYGEQNSPRRTVCTYLINRLNKKSITFEPTGKEYV